MSGTSRTSLDVRKFLLALLVDLVDDKNFDNRFKAAHRELHQFFWKLKTNDAYKAFVRELLFDINGNYPHCDQVDELFQEFQLSGVLSRPNPTYKYNDIAITKSPSGEEFKDGLSPEQKKSYENILKDFKQELGVPDTQ